MSRRNGSIEIIIIVIFVVIASAILLLIKFYPVKQRVEKMPGIVTSFINKTSPIPSPSPFPYQELTIPYLRSQNFSGQLGGLDPYASNSSYSSYITSYESEGFKINGLLTIPKGEQPEGGWPAIVFVHGYIPPTVYKTAQNYASYVDYLAKSGFVVFKIDLRGHDKSEGIALGAYYSGAYIIDTLSAFSALQNADFVNPNKVGLWGHSMGGNVVFRSFVARQNIPAAVIWAGAVYNYSDMAKYRINDNSYRPPTDNSERQAYRDGLRDLYGSFVEGGSFWEQVNPVNYLEGVTGALQINHAVNDDVVNIGYSRDIMKILDNTNIVHELNEYPAGGHNISGNYFTQAMQNTVEFYKKHL